MEGSPYGPEVNLEDPEKERKVQTSPETIGSFAVESKPKKQDQHSPELIGHVLVDSESHGSGEKSTSPESMSRAELLKTSESIIVDGSSLRAIFESHLVGERGLRKLVAEHLKGGDMKAALRVEIIEREIDFERDPALRDHYHDHSAVSAEAPETLNELLHKAQTEIKSDEEEVSFLKAKAKYNDKQQTSQKSSRRVVDVVMISTILILATLVVVLLFTNR